MARFFVFSIVLFVPSFSVFAASVQPVKPTIPVQQVITSNQGVRPGQSATQSTAQKSTFARRGLVSQPKLQQLRDQDKARLSKQMEAQRKQKAN